MTPPPQKNSLAACRPSQDEVSGGTLESEKDTKYKKKNYTTNRNQQDQLEQKQQIKSPEYLREMPHRSTVQHTDALR